MVNIRSRVVASCVSAVVILTPLASLAGESKATAETTTQRDARMAWWREARFGMFIHWGLYSIPAGEWKGETGHAEWIRNTAHIPVEQYDKFIEQFNPVKFDAEAWARMAKDAGMKYIVITSKHHDGFCLFDSQHTDFDIMSTPFKRDIMKELSDACRRHGLRMCWYHSIMDWHNPDYLPRRGWELEQRPANGADFDRFVSYLHNQVTELLTNYGPIGVMWFDGEWEDTWSHEYGQPLYDLCRKLQPGVIVNNRVDKGRGGMAGMTEDARFAGDFGTPEQEIPTTGLPRVDWETCMTMNDHWGFNKRDQNFKSTEDLIRKLVDIASKGGNFLLNVGPKADGSFPQESIDRLREIGDWMDANGESIYGTQASPFKSLPWGRCTQKAIDGDATRLFLHVFDWPERGRLIVPGIFNEPLRASTLAGGRPLDVTRDADALTVSLPRQSPDLIDSVIVLDIVGRPDINDPPTIAAETEIFVNSLDVRIASDRDNVEVRYTTDGSEPRASSPLYAGPSRLTETATISARVFRDGKPVSGVARATFTKVEPRLPTKYADLIPGLDYEYYEGDWDQLPDFEALTPAKSGSVGDFDFSPRERVEHFAFRYRGFVNIPREGVYTFYTASDDGSRLYIDDELVVDNDGPHGVVEKSGVVALAAGAHPITVAYFERTGGDALEVSYAGPEMAKQRIPAPELRRLRRSEATDQTTDRLPAPVARPTPEQIAWHDCEVGMFIHFAPNTWLDREYDDLSLPLEKFNPEQLDTEQWVDAAEALGAKYIVFVAKHAGGFCLWQTDTTDYGVRNTPWRGGNGDILADLSESCRKRGMKLGVYLSPADRKHGVAVGGRCDTPEAQAAYNKLYREQLVEVLSRYGEMFEIWFDGNLAVPVGDILEQYAPHAMIFQGPHATIRWVGNEDGHAPYPAWNGISAEDARGGHTTAGNGTPDGDAWLPNECDVRMRNTWFWRTDNADKLKSVDELMEIYYRSVGYGAVLLLNHTPDPTGLIPEADVRRGAEFAAEVNRRFGKSVAETTGRGESVELALEPPTTLDHAIIMEDIAAGERVREYVIDALVDGNWTELCRGTAIGHKKIDRFESFPVSRLRLRVTRSAGEPLIRKLAVFSVN